ncbi:MAG: hypothetical protein JXB44_09705 [Calditrichaceae bacterium]|nr:hypothetical protein [Calditrichaceae bacterium]RQV94511.1 MAG: hypothetical protein EH224_10225 [Calditrichota bacterium]
MKKFILLTLITCAMIHIGFAQTKIAISTFKNISDDFKLDRWESTVPGILRAELAKDNEFIILEREKLDEVFEEYKLSLSGFADSSNSVELGKIAGADYLISGTIHSMGEKNWIDVNITHVETAEMRLEQVTAYDTEHGREMAELLAANIRYRLGGSGEYKEKIKLSKHPTGYFLLATAGLATATFLLDNQYKDNYDKYHAASSLPDYNNYYDKANDYRKISLITGAVGAFALVGTIYCWVRNKSIHDVEAFSEKKKKIVPQVSINEKGISSVGIKIHF